MDIIIFIAIFIIILLFFYFYNIIINKYITKYISKYINKFTNKNNIECFENNITFITKDNLLNNLLEDKDNYYKTFYKNDLKARNINNVSDYYEKINASVTDADKDIKEKVILGISQANKFLNNINYDYFNGKECNKLLWKIGFVKNKLYESGLPHTRGDIIILSVEGVKYNTLKKLINTLIHEKIHVYQKKFPEKMNIYISFYKFKKIKKREEFDNIRANPDLDNYIYQDSNNNTYKAHYNKNVLSVEDIVYYPKNNQMYEHPFEKMAIEIENKYK